MEVTALRFNGHKFLQVPVDFENPTLPPLPDPELFENVFIKGFSSGQPKFMRKYGDSLLRTMTYAVLAELFGSNNITVIDSIIDFAVSNVFYEWLIEHYDLASLCRLHERSLTSPKSISMKRGDVLESYIAAVEMDVTRCCEEGYREVREWLLSVMALRLRTVSLNRSSGCEYPREDAGLSRDQSDVTTNLGTSASTISTMTRYNAAEGSLDAFRQVIFERMKEVFCQVSSNIEAPKQADLKDFWVTMKYFLDDLCCGIQPGEEIKTLVYYYQVIFPVSIFNVTI